MSLTGLLNKTCTISREAVTQSSVTGEIVRTYSTLASSVYCRVQVVEANQFNGYPEAGETVYNVYFASGQDVGIGDRLTSITGLTNLSLDVKSNAADDCGSGPYARVRCVNVTGGGT